MCRYPYGLCFLWRRPVCSTFTSRTFTEQTCPLISNTCIDKVLQDHTLELPIYNCSILFLATEQLQGSLWGVNLLPQGVSIVVDGMWRFSICVLQKVQGFESASSYGHNMWSCNCIPSLFMLSRCPWLSEYFSAVIPIYIAVTFLFTLANFCMATFMDPGVFPRGKHIWTVLRCKFLTEKLGYHKPTYAI